MSSYQLLKFVNISERNALSAIAGAAATQLVLQDDNWSATLPVSYVGLAVREIEADGDIVLAGQLPADTTITAYTGRIPGGTPDPTITISQALGGAGLPANSLLWITNTWDGTRYLNAPWAVKRVVATFILDGNLSLNAGSMFDIHCNSQWFGDSHIASISRGTASNVLVLEYERGAPQPINGMAQFTIIESVSKASTNPSSSTNAGLRAPSFSLTIQFRYYPN